MLLVTLLTPGAAHAERSASCRSAQDRTVPLKVTLLPSTSTTILSASTLALRTSASSILRLTSLGLTRGLT